MLKNRFYGKSTGICDSKWGMENTASGLFRVLDWNLKKLKIQIRAKTLTSCSLNFDSWRSLPRSDNK
jgi:hypothetical protein